MNEKINDENKNSNKDNIDMLSSSAHGERHE